VEVYGQPPSMLLEYISISMRYQPKPSIYLPRQLDGDMFPPSLEFLSPVLYFQRPDGTSLQKQVSDHREAACSRGGGT
jgi:hypothetical protein